MEPGVFRVRLVSGLFRAGRRKNLKNVLARFARECLKTTRLMKNKFKKLKPGVFRVRLVSGLFRARRRKK